jgi:uncharacterized protein
MELEVREVRTYSDSGVMMKSRTAIVSLLIGMLVSPLCAQTAADSPATRDEILALFNLMHVREQVQPAMEFVARQQRAIIHDNLKRQTPRISPENLAKLDQFTADIMKEPPVDGMLEDMIPVYQKHLTRSDVDAMSAFYSSPTGQKLLREMPAMTTESMQAASPRIQALMDEVMERARAMAKEDEQKGATPKPDSEKK